jgi:hypothetical protein
MDDASFFRQAMTEDQSKLDAQLPVRFEWFDEEDPAETKKCGYPRFKRIQILRTLIPGSKDERVDRVREEHKHRFPRAWAAFLAGDEGVVDGTPLKAFPGLTKDDISTAVHFHVLSVEQLAAMSDEHISNLGQGWRQKRDMAKNWLAAQKAAQPVAELNARVEDERQKRIEAEERAALMEARLAALEGATAPMPEPKKRNRKPKTQTQTTEG